MKINLLLLSIIDCQYSDNRHRLECVLKTKAFRKVAKGFCNRTDTIA